MLLARRRFLFAGIPVVCAAREICASGTQGLEQFGVSAPPCADDKATPAVPADKTFRPGSPDRMSLIEPAVTGTSLVLTGTVIGLKCGRIRGARVDFWQADARGQYDATGFRLRGHQATNADGLYRLTTIVPGASAGRAPHIGVNVVVAGKANFWTEIFFPNDPANASDKRFRPELALKPTVTATGRAGIFDVVLDL